MQTTLKQVEITNAIKAQFKVENADIVGEITDIEYVKTRGAEGQVTATLTIECDGEENEEETTPTVTEEKTSSSTEKKNKKDKKKNKKDKKN